MFETASASRLVGNGIMGAGVDLDRSCLTLPFTSSREVAFQTVLTN